jgi:hypothetical protein
VFAADVRFEGFTATDWERVLNLFRPRRAAAEERDPERPRGGIVAVHGGGRLRKLVHTNVGRLRLDDALPDWPLSPEELARRHRASWAAIIEMGALESIMERFGAGARRGDDLTTQLLQLLALGRDEVIAGRLQHWPARLAGVPVPSAGMVSTTLDAVCPPGRSLLIGLFEDGELWTSLALRRAHGGRFDRVLGPDEVRRDMGLLAGDWRRDYRHLARAVEDELGPLAFGCFAEASAFRALEVDPAPGAWTRAVAVRDVILSPVPIAMAVPLGLDAGRAAFGLARSVAEQTGLWAAVAPALSGVGSVARHMLFGDREPGEVLGFDPLELLRRLLTRDR